MNKKTTTKKKFKTAAKPTTVTKTKIKNKTHVKNESVYAAKRRVKAAPIYITVLALWGVYLYFSINAPNTSAVVSHLSVQTLILLKLSVAIPYLVTWLAAAYSVIRIKRYSLAIAPSLESGAFNKISWGIAILLGSLIVSTLSGAIRTFNVGHPEMRPVLTIITNYAYVFPYLAAFLFFLRGALDLARQSGVHKISTANYVVYGIPLILLAYEWLELIFSNQSRIIPGSGSPFASYYLKDSLLILTIVLPSLLTWVIGIFTVVQLRAYYKKVTGYIYKRALSSLVYGFVSVIFASIFLQALQSLGARRLLDLGLEKLLGLIYIFLILQVLGFLLISRGARKLTKIEAV